MKTEYAIRNTHYAMSHNLDSVAHTLTLMRGVWHDHLEIFDLAGNALREDTWSGAQGAAPFDNLVYIEFDGENYRQTNVTFRGRPLHVRSFAGKMRDGVMVFNKLGPEAPEHVGVSGGAGILWFVPRAIDDAWSRYSEPDCIWLIGDKQRIRSTILYRHGVATRMLTARGTKISDDPLRRVDFDPRGAEGDVHAVVSETKVFRK